MNVGILTFHMAHNCGAMLQAHALCESVKALSTGVCEIIDYRLSDIYDKYESLLCTHPVSPRRLKLDGYMKTELSLSPRISQLSEAKPYDLYIIGGDQVWNPEITNGYRKEYFGQYFPAGSRCVSYAASTGSPINDPAAFARRLERLQAVSVRESWLAEAIRPWWLKPIAWCLDPVLLLGKKYWGHYCPAAGIEGYILIYAFEITEDEYTQIEQMAKAEHLNIIELLTHDRQKRPPIQLEEDYGPKEFIAYIQNARYIYTDSYHGALFSIIFDKLFTPLAHGMRENARISDIIRRLAMVRGGDGFYMTSASTAKRLMDGRSESMLFLQDALASGDGAK